jgi:hypothetical protein
LALSRAANLVSTHLFPHASWTAYPEEKKPGAKILYPILKAFLSLPYGRGGSDAENTKHTGNSARDKFVWEDYYKLQRITVAFRIFDIASKFTNLRRGMKRPETMKSDAAGSRRVLFRDVRGHIPQRIAVTYDFDHEWTNMVCEELAEFRR